MQRSRISDWYFREGFLKTKGKNRKIFLYHPQGLPDSMSRKASQRINIFREHVQFSAWSCPKNLWLSQLANAENQVQHPSVSWVWRWMRVTNKGRKNMLQKRRKNIFRNEMDYSGHWRNITFSFWSGWQLAWVNQCKSFSLEITTCSNP